MYITASVGYFITIPREPPTLFMNWTTARYSTTPTWVMPTIYQASRQCYSFVKNRLTFRASVVPRTPCLVAQAQRSAQPRRIGRTGTLSDSYRHFNCISPRFSLPPLGSRPSIRPHRRDTDQRQSYLGRNAYLRLARKSAWVLSNTHSHGCSWLENGPTCLI